MANQDIRQYAKACGVRLWQIADAFGIADCNFSRKLRHELPQAERLEITRVIDRLAAEQGGSNGEC